MVSNTKRDALLKKVVQSERLVSQKLKNNEYRVKRRATLQKSILHCIRCPVCLDRYSTAKRARVLPCWHTVCEQCVTSIVKMERDEVMKRDGLDKVPKVEFKCPCCRIMIRIHSFQSARSLAKNRTVMAAAEMLGGTDLSGETEVQVPLKERHSNATCKTLEKRFKNLELKCSELTVQMKKENMLHEKLEEKAALLLKCPHCQKLYKENPILIRCGHSICVKCFDSQREDQFITCQTCNLRNRTFANGINYCVINQQDEYITKYL
ncbi:unnamed protein product [Caenorhabditis nigoni]